MNRSREIILILHNLRSAENVGAIFRVADAIGTSKIFLTGYTPTPRDRFGRPNRRVVKTALGAEKFVPWEQFTDIGRLLYKLQANSYKLVALEQSNRSVDYRQVKIKGPTAIIVGNEVRGLNPSILKKCDTIAEIPMRGRKESLNVAVACGVFLFSSYHK
ncbi:MAG: RNA methyltransferase [Candidatus Vogelbacteria bacterium]|nr:RNA methyltransferase [Candidatus Vogelbacteria bacterium]